MYWFSYHSLSFLLLHTKCLWYTPVSTLNIVENKVDYYCFRAHILSWSMHLAIISWPKVFKACGSSHRMHLETLEQWILVDLNFSNLVETQNLFQFYLSYVSAALINTMTKINLGGKGLFRLTAYSPSERWVKFGGRDWSGGLGRMLLNGLPFMACSANFLYTPGTSA